MTNRARDSHLLVHEVGDEIVVYDRDEKLAHRLNETASQVWGLLDGKRTTPDIANALGLEESVVELAIDDLAIANLLEEAQSLSLSRRAALRKLANVAAVGALLGTITSIPAPLAAQSRSGRQTQVDPPSLELN